MSSSSENDLKFRMFDTAQESEPGKFCWIGLNDGSTRRPGPRSRADLISQIRGSTTTPQIDFSANMLGQSNPSLLREMLQALPPNVIELNLSLNTLNKMALEHLVQTLQHLPQHVRRVNLSHNGLGKFNFDGFKLIIQAIPPSVETIDLVGNNLSNYKTDDLTRFLDSLIGRSFILDSSVQLSLQP